MKLVLSRAMTLETSAGGARRRRKVLVLDISRAHLHPLVRRELFIELPPEDHTEEQISKRITGKYAGRTQSGSSKAETIKGRFGASKE